MCLPIDVADTIFKKGSGRGGAVLCGSQPIYSTNKLPWSYDTTYYNHHHYYADEPAP